jgi:hypothetical protein
MSMAMIIPTIAELNVRSAVTLDEAVRLLLLFLILELPATATVTES